MHYSACFRLGMSPKRIHHVHLHATRDRVLIPYHGSIIPGIIPGHHVDSKLYHTFCTYGGLLDTLGLDWTNGKVNARRAFAPLSRSLFLVFGSLAPLTACFTTATRRGYAFQTASTSNVLVHTVTQEPSMLFQVYLRLQKRSTGYPLMIRNRKTVPGWISYSRKNAFYTEVSMCSPAFIVFQ